MKKITILIICTLITLSGYVAAQTQNLKGQALIDSLLRELPTKCADTNKCKLLDMLARTYLKIDPRSSLATSDTEYALATQLHWKRGIALSQSNIGRYYSAIGDYLKAKEQYLAALHSFREIADSTSIAAVCGNMGVVCKYLGDQTMAINYYTTALQIFSSRANTRGIVATDCNIANILTDQGRYPEALERYYRALKTSEQKGYHDYTANILNGIASIHVELRDYTKALEYFGKALAINENLGDKASIAAELGNVGKCYLSVGNPDTALIYLTKSLNIYEAIDNKRGIAVISGKVSSVYLEMKDYTHAKAYLNRSLQLSKKIGAKPQEADALFYLGQLHMQMAGVSNVTVDTGFGFAADTTIKQQLLQAISFYNQYIEMLKEIDKLEGVDNAYYGISRAYSFLGEHKAAYHAYKQFVIAKDSLMSKESEKKILQQQMAFDFGKKEDSLKLEAEKKELALQKEMQLNALRYEFDKKQSLAKSEKQKQQLKYEQQLAEEKIKNDFAQKTAAAEAIAERKELERRAKDVITAEHLETEKKGRTATAIVAALMALSALGSFFAYRQKKKDNTTITSAKQRSEELLLNILPSEVADELKANGTAAAKYFDNVTVLFTDFVGFSTASERMTPQELVNELHACFQAFDGIMGKYGIEKIKTVGDAYLAVCGLPQPATNHAENVIKAVIEIREFMVDRYAKLGSKTFQIRIGVHSGSLVAGIVGVKKFAYDVWGDTVNTAARMEQNSEPGKINISAATYEIVKDKFSCVYRGEIAAKNKGMLKMYFVG